MTAKILSMTMDSVLLDLERARMEREDFRQGNGPHPAAAMFDPNISWRSECRALIQGVIVMVEGMIEGRAQASAQRQQAIADRVTGITATVDALELDSSSSTESEQED